MIVLDEYISKVTYRQAVLMEERIRVLLRERPRWLPYRIWKFVIARLIIIETSRL